MSIAEQITDKLTAALQPTHLDVINESFMHNVPKGSESHFKVVVVAEAFSDTRLIQRHRQINELLATELAEHIHALSIHAYTPEEWEARGGAPDSPKCRGGSKK